MNAYLLQCLILYTAVKHDDDTHRYHYVYDFDTQSILNDLHQVITKVNKTLEFFNGMSHKTVKSFRKQLLYLNERYKAIENSLLEHHTTFIAIKIYSKIDHSFIY